MHFKTKLMILSIIVIGACMLQLILHKGVYEGFTQFSSDENKLSFNQFDRKYNSTNDCKANDTEFDIGQYVEVYVSDDEKATLVSDENIDETKFDELIDYDKKWTSGKVITNNLNIYSIELEDKTVITDVKRGRIKNHHQNACKVCGNNDNECSQDCIDPINVGGDCLPIKTGKNGNGEDILYQICPRICRNDNVNVIDLACGTDNCCRGCGFSVFEVSDNIVIGKDNKETSGVINKLTQIPYTQANYTVDPDYNYADEMAKETKRKEDALAAMMSSSGTATSASSGTAASASSGTATSASSGTATSASVAAQDTEKQETSNVVNALTDTENCWLGPTGHDAFMYCGPAPFSF